MSLSPFDQAFIVLENAEAAVIQLHGFSIFRSNPPHWNWPLLEEKRTTCPTAQAYFKALEAYEILEKEYMELHQVSK
jgi:hypothetical protein